MHLAAAHLLRLAALTALLVPVLEVAAIATQKPEFFEELRFLPLPSLVSSAEVLPDVKALRLEAALPQRFAQADNRQAEANRLLQQGNQQFQASQFREALQSWEQALAIYREIGDRRSEGQILGNLGGAYYSLGDYRRAIEFMEQGLVIFRELGDRVNEGNALDNLGLAYRDLEDYHRAIEFYEQSLAIFRELGDQDGEGYTLLNLGLAHSNLGNYHRAIEFYEQSLPIFRELDNQDGEGYSLNNLGLAYGNVGSYNHAIEFYEQSLAIFRELEDRRSEGVALGNLGDAYWSLGDYIRAVDFYEQSLAIFRELEDRRSEGVALGNLGDAYWSLGDYIRAVDFYEQRLLIAHELKDRRSEGIALGNLGIVYESLGDYHRAIDLQEQALAITRELKDRRNEGAALGNLGNAYQGLGDYRRAIDLQEQALAIVRELDDRRNEGAALGNLGNTYQSMGDYRRAIEYHERALAIARDLNYRAGEGRALGSLGNAYLRLDDYRRAIAYHEQHLAIARDIGNLSGEGVALGNLGSVYWSLGDYRRAIEYHEQALAIAREIGDFIGERLALGNLGSAYCSLGDYLRAIDYYEQDLAIAREIGKRDGEGATLGNLGLVYSLLGNHSQAIDFHQQSLVIARDIGDRRGEGRVLNNLGITYRSLGELDRALDFYSQALPIFNSLGSRAEEGRTLSNIGKILNDQDQPELAIAFLKASVDVREAIRGDIRGLDTSLQQSFTDTIADDYRLLADLLLQQDRIIEAQRVLDLLKVQELDDYLDDVQRNAQTETGVVYLRPEEAILARYDDLQNSAIAAGQELDELKAIPQEQRSDQQMQRIAQLTDLLDDINGDFRDFARSPEIRSLIDQLSFEAQEASLSLNQLDRLRDELQQLNAAIFYPLILEDRLELVITVPDSPPLRRTVNIPREQLNETILAFRTALTNPAADVETPAQQLYDWLIRPLEADLAAAGVETIIYSPDGQLRYIPLAALHDGDQWLIQQYRINNITAESLTDLTDSDTTQPTILAAAYADQSLVHSPEVNGTTYTFRGLPGAGAEVATLPTETKFLDEAFSLDAVRPLMDEYSILHLATHAAFVPGVPEDSFILFGNGDTPTLRDVEDWSLNGVDLVVLSACETGVGGLGNGEEILGLGYQFQLSGAKAVMSSLWKVSDRGTQTLMTEFYAALNQGLTKAEALQVSQQALITGESVVDGGEIRAGAQPLNRDGAAAAGNYPGYSHPYYWAPFILIGNGL